MRLPERVTICEVGTRDGFQIEPEFIDTDQKVEVVDLLAAAGVPRIEVTSFVSPKAVPQLRDAEQVMARIARRPGTRYAALVPNDKGASRAVDAGRVRQRVQRGSRPLPARDGRRDRYRSRQAGGRLPARAGDRGPAPAR